SNERALSVCRQGRKFLSKIPSLSELRRNECRSTGAPSKSLCGSFSPSRFIRFEEVLRKSCSTASSSNTITWDTRSRLESTSSTWLFPETGCWHALLFALQHGILGHGTILSAGPQNSGK